MKLTAKHGNGGHVTSYTVIIGSKEARDCGFLDEEGNPLPLKKTVDVKHGKIIFEVDKTQSD